MYVDSCTTGGKYTRHLLRETFREDGKVKHRTVANLSNCTPEEVQAVKLALKHKDDLSSLISIRSDISLEQGLSFGAVWLVFDIARQLGITEALGSSMEGKLALWQIIARVINQGSRLSATRLAREHAACDILGLIQFNENDLYSNLDWLSENQEKIETKLFNIRYKKDKPSLYLYDVTSSYFEGEMNELAAYGYNRDGKKGKKQIVVGLLCDDKGCPLSIEVFSGNTSDPTTFASQIKKVTERFGGGEVTFVGDRGMIKSVQIENITANGFHYITAITKPQIEKLLKRKAFQFGIFDHDLSEVVDSDGIRYILRRNPIRVKEIAASRENKLRSFSTMINKQNEYLLSHLRASVKVALRKISARSEALGISGWVNLVASDRVITFCIDENSLSEVAKLDGCYALKTDLSKTVASKETVHSRYKDLALVEWAFRTSKTVELELRPIYVRLENRTRAHVFLVMLAYIIIRELSIRWRNLDRRVSEGINDLATLCTIEVLAKGKRVCNKIPTPRGSIQQLLDEAAVRLPEALPCLGINVATKKILQKRRKNF